MGHWHCIRCGRDSAPRMHRPPFPGPLGERIGREACAFCWGEWDRARIMIINEYRLDMTDPGQFAGLIGQMRRFLHLEEIPSRA